MHLKKIKLSMEPLFERMKEEASTGELPRQEDVSQFVRLCRQMYDFADDPWLIEAEDFLHLANQLTAAVKNESLSEVVLLIESLDDACAYCHRTFRDSAES